MPILGGGSSVRAGTVQAWPSNSIPAGWLKCNGAAVSRTLYAALFNEIGTTYGAPDGSTFNVPDMRGEFLRGLDDGRGVDSGRGLGTFQADQNQSHRHTFYYQRGATTNTNADHIQDGRDYSLEQSTGANRSANFAIELQGGNESRPRNRAMHFIIKF